MVIEEGRLALSGFNRNEGRIYASNFWPDNLAGVVTVMMIVGLAIFASALPVLGIDLFSGQAIFIVLTAALFVVPRSIRARGLSGFRRSVTQRFSGKVILGTVAFGLIAVFFTSGTGRAWTSIVGGSLIVILAVVILVIMARPSRHSQVG